LIAVDLDPWALACSKSDLKNDVGSMLLNPSVMAVAREVHDSTGNLLNLTKESTIANGSGRRFSTLIPQSPGIKRPSAARIVAA
jgi:hypothetical protein